MFEYIEFYTKNLSNLTILLVIGAVIAILDITFRNVVKGVYLNVRENMRMRHGMDGGREGMKNKKDNDGGGGGGGGGGGSGGGGGGGGGGSEEESKDESCPKDCNAVQALQKKLTVLIENATKLQKDIQDNNKRIEAQHYAIANMDKSVSTLIEKSK
jgi:hypothetical protein